MAELLKSRRAKAAKLHPAGSPPRPAEPAVTSRRAVPSKKGAGAAKAAAAAKSAGGKSAAGKAPVGKAAAGKTAAAKAAVAKTAAGKTGAKSPSKGRSAPPSRTSNLQKAGKVVQRTTRAVKKAAKKSTGKRR
jgi:hypothetical protein